MADQTIKDIKKDIYLALHKTHEMLELVEEGFAKNKLTSLDQSDELAGEIHASEIKLTATLAKMASTSTEARAILSVPAHIGKVAASITRIAVSSRVRIKDGMLFSDKAVNETGKLFAKAKEALHKVGEMVVGDSSAHVDAVIASSDAMERMANDFATAHEDRLVTGECAPKSSSTYLCILYAFEDMGAHLKNAVKKLAGK